MQVDASCKQMIRPVHAMMQIVRYLPPSSSGELVGSHSQEAVAGTVTCWASKSWLVVQFPGLEKLLISECGNASVGKKKVEKLRLIQGISNSKRKSVYRGIILKSQEELVNVRVFNDSWNANNTPAYSLVQTQSLMLWTVLINGILSHEETDMRPFRLPMLSPNPFRRDLNVALWWLIAGFVANQLTEFWDFLLPDLHVVDLTRWQHLSQLGYHRIIHTEYESGMIRYDSTLRFPPLPYWWIRDHAIRLCQGQCLQCVPQVRQNRRAKFPSLRMYEWLQVDIEFNWAKNIKKLPTPGYISSLSAMALQSASPQEQRRLTCHITTSVSFSGFSSSSCQKVFATKRKLADQAITEAKNLYRYKSTMSNFDAKSWWKTRAFGSFKAGDARGPLNPTLTGRALGTAIEVMQTKSHVMCCNLYRMMRFIESFLCFFLNSSESLLKGSSGKACGSSVTPCDSPCLVSWALLECFHLQPEKIATSWKENTWPPKRLSMSFNVVYLFETCT